MAHFELREWVDFVRGLTAPENREKMQQHLVSGCDVCGESGTLLERIVAASSADARCPVPETCVLQAKAIFAARAPQRWLGLPRALARLAYDSLRDPLPAGVRSLQRTSRQALYEAGDYCLDLRLESEPGAPRFSLVGQIANRKAPSENVAGVPVFLLQGEQVLASDESNEFGEFHLECRYGARLRLCVPILSFGKRIEVPLTRLLGPPGRMGIEGGQSL